jgi:hypothetical protein
MAQRPYTVAYYREQAEEARHGAAKPVNEESREDYLRLAVSWDKLADETDSAASNAIAQLMRSIQKT